MSPVGALGLNRDADPTILLLRCKLSAATGAVQDALGDGFARANLDATEYDIECVPVSNKSVLRVKGAPPYAARKVQQAVGTDASTTIAGNDSALLSPNGDMQELFLAIDENASQIRREFGFKCVRRELELHYNHLRFYSDKEKGEVSCQWRLLVHMEPSVGEHASPLLRHGQPSGARH